MNQEIAIYQHPESGLPIEMLLGDGSVWLTQNQISTLFQTTRNNITLHIKNIFRKNELQEEVVCKDSLLTTPHGAVKNKTQTRKVKIYNLNLILAVGYRIDSNQSTQFQIWANSQITKFNQNNPTLRVIHSKIFQIRGCTVMIDSDLASFYQTKTSTLKQAVRRNLDRFPEDFMFELNDQEVNFMVSQSVIPSVQYLGGAQPFAFTEQGVAMLSAVLNTPIAVDISLQIIRAFVEIRKLALSQYSTENRLAHIEQKQVEVDAWRVKAEKRQTSADKKINQLFEAIDQKKTIPNQKVFFDGHIFDAHKLVSDIIGSATEEIILIDNYVDLSVLTLFSTKQSHVHCTIYTKHISERLQLDARRFNEQYGRQQDSDAQFRTPGNEATPAEGSSGYGGLEIYRFTRAHDRFLIIDRTEVYHIGASLKDLGKKWFAFTKIEGFAEKILQELSF